MKSARIKVKRKFTARDAADIVECSNRFASDISFCQPSKIINGKSLMGTISMGLAAGDDFTIVAKGDDEETAIVELTKYFG